MGWLFREGMYEAKSYAEEKAEVEAYYTVDREDENGNKLTVRAIYSANVRPNWIVACEVLIDPGYDYDPHCYDVETLPDGRRRFVYLTVKLVKKGRNGAGFYYGTKEVDESCGPNHIAAPLKAFKLASEIIGDSDSAQWARRFREDCQKATRSLSRAKSVKVGQTIKTREEFIWTRDGADVREDTFKAVDWFGKRAFYSEKVGYVRLRNSDLVGCTVVS